MMSIELYYKLFHGKQTVLQRKRGRLWTTN